MTINYTSLLSLAEPVTGTESGTWGDDVNKGITDYLDIAIAGTNTISTDGDVTLTLTSGSSSGNGIVSTTAQYAMLLMSGSRTAARNVTVPASSRYYIVFNNTTGGYAVTVRGAGPTTGVSIANGEKALVAWNGTDYVKISNTSGAGVFSSITNTGLTSGRVVYSTTGGLETDSANLTFNGTTLTANTLNLTNALGTAYGGTGLTSYTAGDLPYYASGTALSKLGIGTNGQILTSSGTAPQWSTLSGVAVTTFSAGTTGFTPNSATSGAITLAGTLATTNGGTGLTSFTSNGILYASSTSALATGSALTFDGSSLTVFGGGAIKGNKNASGQFLAFVAQNSTQNYGTYIDQDNAGSNSWSLFDTTNSQTALRYYPSTSGYWQFYVNNSEQMRLTSTGLGIGTSSPSEKLQVVGNIQSKGSALSVTDVNGTNPFYINRENTVTGNLQFRYSSTSLMELTQSGNLGLGVTPSAWGTNKAFQFGAGGLNGSVYASLSGVVGFTNNYYNNGGDIYIANGYATRYYQYAGQHVWNTAPSGTAGNAITFTQAMTLDASGVLSVGTTSANANDGTFVAAGSIGTGQGAANTVAQINIWETTSGNKAGLWFGAMTNSNVGVIGSRTASGAIAFQTYNSGWAERARIDSSGNWLVGQSSTTQPGVGNTTAGSAIRAGGAGFFSVTGSQALYVNTNTDGQIVAILRSGTAVGSISVTTTGTSYNTSSDYRLKTVIGAVSDAGSRIDALEPIEYEWKANGKRTRGFLAHKFQEVYTDSVTGEKDAVDAEGKPVYQAMQASSPEVIADLVAEIQSLRKRLAALEAK